MSKSPPNPIYSSRAAALRWAIDHYAGGKVAAFAKMAGKPATQITMWKREKRGMREDIAAAIEQAAKLPEGLLTRPSVDAAISVDGMARHQAEHPTADYTYPKGFLLQRQEQLLLEHYRRLTARDRKIVVRMMKSMIQEQEETTLEKKPA